MTHGQDPTPLVRPQTGTDNIICMHFLQNLSVDMIIFEEKLFILHVTIGTMFLQIYFKIFCHVLQTTQDPK
jgi:hypothetical protein